MDIKEYLNENKFTHFKYDNNKYKIGRLYSNEYFECKMLGCRYGKNHPLPMYSDKVDIINKNTLMINFRLYEFY